MVMMPTQTMTAMTSAVVILRKAPPRHRASVVTYRCQAVVVPPRPAPDLGVRRDQVTAAARDLAEPEGWAALTMRRLAGGLGVTQPVLCTAFTGRQALIDAVAPGGFTDLADALRAAEASPSARMRAHLGLAAAHPRVYEAMLSMPSGLSFADQDTPAPLRHAFASIRDAFPDPDGTRAEVAWPLLHGLATLQASGRLAPGQARARLDLAHRMLTQPTQEENR